MEMVDGGFGPGCNTGSDRGLMRPMLPDTPHKPVEGPASPRRGFRFAVVPARSGANSHASTHAVSGVSAGDAGVLLGMV